MEKFDLYDHLRRPLGRTMAKGEEMPQGCRRLMVHICIFNEKGEMLIQQRQNGKKWGNLWDVSVGGGVQAGETTQQAAHRELMEELGLKYDFQDLSPAVTTTFHKGFDDLYIIHADPALSSVRLQPEEVQAVRWASREEILDMLDCGAFLPYHPGFMEYIFFRRDYPGYFHHRQ